MRVLVFCAVLILYAMLYLVVLSVNVGDPQTFPPMNTASSTTETCSKAGGSSPTPHLSPVSRQ